MAQRKQPTEEFINSLTIPGVVNYKTPANGRLTDDQKKATHISAGGSALSDPNAVVSVEAKKLENSTDHGTVYEIKVVDAANNSVALNQAVTLSLPYPNGMSQNASSGYGFAVIHTKFDGTQEIMNSVDGSVSLSANGLEVTASSFSPYTVVWGKASEISGKYPSNVVPESPVVPNVFNLPKTGDSSNLTLYVALLALCVGGLAVRLAASRRCARR